MYYYIIMGPLMKETLCWPVIYIYGCQVSCVYFTVLEILLMEKVYTSE